MWQQAQLAMAMVVDREKEIEEFVPEQYYYTIVTTIRRQL